MVFNQELFNSEKNKFGEALATSRDAKRAKLHAENQVKEEAKNAPPEGMERYFRVGEPIYRGDSRKIPASANTPEKAIEHLFANGSPKTGKSWTLKESTARHFARNNEWVNEQQGSPSTQDAPSISYVLHSEVIPKHISFDTGHIEDDAGKKRNWSWEDWRTRSSKPNGEREIVMKTKSEIPVTGITFLNLGDHISHHQFSPPKTVVTRFPPEGEAF